MKPRDAGCTPSKDEAMQAESPRQEEYHVPASHDHVEPLKLLPALPPVISKELQFK
jgi:hypothetical protein